MLPLPGVHLFSLTIFLSATLAFLIQPLIAKKLLPLLGGSPSVWNTCLVFFQAALLLGYALSDRLTHVKLRVQLIAQLSLLAIAAVLAFRGTFLPLAPPEVAASPTLWLLATLTTTVGVPFLALSVNSTLLQHWYGAAGAPETPYALYRASNLGSFVGLLLFPFVFEPLFALGVQGRLWLVGFVVLLGLVAACGRAAVRGEHVQVRLEPAGEAEAISVARRARWVLVAFVPSSLAIGVTTFISTDLAAVPLLWVVPLSLYLLSFAVTFGPRPAVRLQTIAGWIYPVVAVLVLVTVHRPALLPTAAHLVIHPLLLFVVGLLAHGFLAADRPAPRHLTQFYLFLAIGGVLGGVFNALVAPHVFDSLIEYPLVIALAAFVVPLARHGMARPSLLDVALGLGVGLVAMAATAATQQTMPYGLNAVLVIFALPAVACLMFRERWLRLGTAVLSILLIATLLPGTPGLLLYETRTFFGTMRVTAEANGRFNVLRHGTTTHGRQDRRGALMRKLPLSYYHPQGPIGQLIMQQRSWKRPLRFGVVGLGTGTMAAYTEPGDEIVFYEIDPEVVKIAQTPPWFSFLADSAAKPRIVLGDARISLQRSPGERYDLLLLDAFSSDAIPVHLITREAFEIYRRHVSPEGLIVTHVSNRHLEMRPTVVSIAASVGLTSVHQISVVTPQAAQQGFSSSRWVASGTPEALAANGLPTRTWVASPDEGVRPWTDEYSNLAGVVRWRRQVVAEP